MSKGKTLQKCIRRSNITLSVERRPNYSQGSEESFLVSHELKIQTNVHNKLKFN